MNQIRSFGDLLIKQPDPKNFVGEKIPAKKILGKQIIVHDYKIGPSNYKGERLDLQIELNNDKRVVFTSAGALMETIKLIPKDKFPFSTTIIEENDRFLFT